LASNIEKQAKTPATAGTTLCCASEGAVMKNIYVGNLSSSTTEATLRSLFEPFGKISKVHIISGRGFGFVEMQNDAEGVSALSALNGKSLDGNTLTINEARPKR
jgi:RNA recognition motif-containing protein